MSVGLYVGISIGTFVIIIVLRILVCMCKDEKKTDPQNRGAVVVITSANGVDQQNLHTTEACPAQLYVVGMSAPPGNSSYDNSSNNRGAVVVIAGANGANQQNLHTTEPYPTQLYVVGLSAPPGYTPYDNSSNNLSNDLPPPYSVAVSQQVATTTVHQTNVAK
ncbi:uncharacterized protein [Periplaneta americana]|uniref:uncharacterized protein n=1 Tax=Periplaneta americana TaxID=6978 RepID=UPI0037E77AE4